MTDLVDVSVHLIEQSNGLASSDTQVRVPTLQQISKQSQVSAQNRGVLLNKQLKITEHDIRHMYKRHWVDKTITNVCCFVGTWYSRHQGREKDHQVIVVKSFGHMLTGWGQNTILFNYFLRRQVYKLTSER
jgi:hypothetical protein